jgi:hypothetical protein
MDSNKGKWRVRLIKGGTYLDTMVDDEREGAKMRDVVILKITKGSIASIYRKTKNNVTKLKYNTNEQNFRINFAPVKKSHR